MGHDAINDSEFNKVSARHIEEGNVSLQLIIQRKAFRNAFHGTTSIISRTIFACTHYSIIGVVSMRIILS